MYAAMMVAPAAISPTTIGGHQEGSGDFGMIWDGVDGAGGALCPRGEGVSIGGEIMTSRPAFPMTGLPAPVVDWMRVGCERRTVMMTARTPSAATSMGGCLHHRFMGLAPLQRRRMLFIPSRGRKLGVDIEYITQQNHTGTLGMG
jgi:hypothetical protein